MTKPRVFISSLLATLALTTIASSALAQIIIEPPDPAKSTLQSAYIAVVGSTNGLPDNCADTRCGNFTATIRDWANNVLPGATVTIDFSACTDIQIACDQLTATTGQTYLGGKKVSGVTNSFGQFTFRVMGAANAVPTMSNTTSPGIAISTACAQVYVEGWALSPALIVAAYDVNGLGSPNAAVNGADASLVGAEVVKVGLGATPHPRDDYNYSNSVTGPDASAIATMVVQAALGTGSQNTGPFCP